MNSTLKMLLPTTLPSAMSGEPPSAEPTLTAISGALVPKATTVRPMISGGMPAAAARREAPRTSNSAPSTSTTNPPIRRSTFDMDVYSGCKLPRTIACSATAGKGPPRQECRLSAMPRRPLPSCARR